MSETNNLLNRALVTVHDNRAILIRLVVGLIFLSEGIQKFIFPDALGTGRFMKIGFSQPEFWAYFTAVFEIICGLLLLLGLFTRIASIPLLIIMITAFIATKWPILMHRGFWAMAHEYRTDFAMTVLLIYLLLYGSGKNSVDYRLSKRLKQKS
ncbi:DoxX family protein [Prolixibacter sp. SD074]|uniref:DoxX family protein n=1 Tax=Prolixibacter sp. SD074 TaxID=2652391 RepID=UPI001298FA02|nr:DoxX family protein [Prolixibacter sp. SD074]